MNQDKGSPDFKELFKRSLTKVSELKTKLETLESARTEPIAVIGMGCRAPAGSISLEAFWEALEEGRDGVVPIPAQRWPQDALPIDNPAVRWAGLIDSIDSFDAAFFGISPREAVSLDPQQRLLLEVAWEALERAGLIPAGLMGSATGVFVGLCSTDYRQLVGQKEYAALDAFDATGTLASTAAGRLSYTLGLQGPCLTIDTACSSSLVAVHEACASLRNRECDLALAGGANVILDPGSMLVLSKTQALSPEGRCKTFDAGANGFVRGEGCGVIVLKRLGDALAAQDRIEAVILGSAVNQDGRSTGLTTPNVLAQQDMLRMALLQAKVTPSQIGLIETHGTGTSVGDPIEVEALKAVLGAAREDGSRCYLGAVKTNLGHLEGAAGIVGLIKAVLCLQHEAIPKNLHFRVLNPRIELEGTPLTIPREKVAWPAGKGPRIAGVSSFGLSGTNAHVLLQEAPKLQTSTRAEHPAYILPLSGKTAEALKAQAGQYSHHLQTHREQHTGEICHSAAVTRTHFDHRLAIVGTKRQDLLEALHAFQAGRATAGLSHGVVPEQHARKLVFVFPGQGGQWVGMGKELLAAEPVFRQRVTECDRILSGWCGWSLLSVLQGDGADSGLERVDVVQPAVFAMQAGLAALWQSWGVEPAAVVGHSMGEVAAAYVAGALTLEAACRIICQRSQLVRRYSGQGGMAVVELSAEETQKLLDLYSGKLAIAACNGPRTTVISGERAALAHVLAQLGHRGVFSRLINVDYASHSPQMDVLEPELLRLLSDIPAVKSQLPWYSTVTGKEQKTEISGEYWRRNLREPVLFWPAMLALARDGFDTMLELNPHPVLLPSITAGLEGTVPTLQVIATMRRDQGGLEPQLQALAALYAHGCAIPWQKMYATGGRMVALPTYPWQRRRFWLETGKLRGAQELSMGSRTPDESIDRARKLLYRPVFRPSPLNEKPPIPAAGTWVLLLDEQGIGERLAQALEAAGAACIRVHWDAQKGAEQVVALCRDRVAQGIPLRGMVHLGATDETRRLPGDRWQICLDGVHAVLASLQALARFGKEVRIPVWLVTRGAVSVGATEPIASSEQAALWGLGRVFSLEHPELWGGLIDLPAANPSAHSALLASHLLADDHEDHVALRPAGRFVQRLQRFLPTSSTAMPWRTHGTALITGGLGALGRLTARWLFAHGAEHLVLTSRQGLSTPGAAEAAESLREFGAKVTVVAADVSDRQAMEAVLAFIDAKLPPLRSVFHAAGVAAHSRIAELDLAASDAVMAPKVGGTLALEDLMRQRELDAFVCFSSISAVWGGLGLAAYAAGNAFEDAWAKQQRALGRKTVSINWGLWGRGLSTPQVTEALVARGVKVFQAEDALQALSLVLAEDSDQAVIVDVDWQQFRAVYESQGKRHLLRELEGSLSEETPVPLVPPGPSWYSRLALLGAGARRAEAEQTVLAAVASVLRLDGSTIHVHRPFRDLGLDSVTATELSKCLSSTIGERLPTTLAFDFPTVDKIASFLLSKLETYPAARAEAVVAARLTDEPIAIIGMGCRFPGGVMNPEDLWRLLERGEDAITELPRERWEVQEHSAADAQKAGNNGPRWGGTLAGVDQFDAAFFGISPREAMSLDPQQRILLEVSWEALERAGQAADNLLGSASGVFIASGSNEYGAMVRQGLAPGQRDAYAITGNMLSMAAGRLSYLLGLNGPSLVVETACSSSLVAVHLACQSLRSSECSLAIAGGTNLLLSAETTEALTQLQAFSYQGRCKTFDASADGFVRSEGCGVVVLKRLGDAQRAGDPILAVIMGTAVNQDGRSNGLTAPNGPAQQAVIRAALAQAGVEPCRIGYVEAHGTGTALGDPIEMQALAQVLMEKRPMDRPVIVGALKSNIGHTELAAGVAGLIKAVLVLQHAVIPRNLHFRTPSSHIAWDRLPVRIPTETMPWPAQDGPRLAGVSSFGLSGTNAHVVLKEAPPRVEHPPTSAERQRHILPLSARSGPALQAQAKHFAEHLDHHPEEMLADICYSAANGRAAMEERFAVVAASAEQARKQLEQVAQGEADPEDAAAGKQPQGPKVAFLFTGQGSQYPGMGAELYKTEPVFRQAIDLCAEISASLLPRPLLSVLYPADGAETPIDQTWYTQPCLFAVEYALAHLWMSWGVKPAAVLGHSVGEYVAACLAGVMSVEDSLRLLAERGRLMQSLPSEGAMAAVQAPAEIVAMALRPQAREVSIAAYNGPEHVVISGRRATVHAICEDLGKQGFKTTKLNVSHGFHSPQMDAILEPFERAASRVNLKQPVLPLISNLSGQEAKDEVTRADYWKWHIREPVRFAQSLQKLKELGINSFVEIGAQPTLLGMGLETLGKAGNRWHPSLRKGQDAWSVILPSLARLWMDGVTVDWRAFDKPYTRKFVLLPTYPWQHQRFWIDPLPSERHPRRSQEGHPLLGLPTQVSTQPGMYIWEAEIDLNRLPYLRSHRVQEAILFPGTGYIEMALAAAKSLWENQAYAAEEIVLREAMPLSQEHPTIVQTVITEEAAGQLRFRIASRQVGTHAGWTQHASGRLGLAADKTAPPALSPQTIRTRCIEKSPRGDYYASLAKSGSIFGPEFQGVTQMWFGPAESLGEVSLPESLAASATEYIVHPALLDACLQGMLAAMGNQVGAGPLVPVSIEAVRVYAPCGPKVLSYTKIRSHEPAVDALRKADVLVLSTQGQVLAEVLGIQLQAIEQSANAGKPFHINQEWSPQPLLKPNHAVSGGRYLLLADSGGLAEALRKTLEDSGGAVTVLPGKQSGVDWTHGLAASLTGSTYTAIVQLWSLDGASGGQTNLASLEEARERDCGVTLHIVQTLMRAELHELPRLWLVTRGVHAVRPGDGPLSPVGGMLWGLGRTIVSEHPELSCTCVDLAPTPWSGELEALGNELSSASREQEVALRADGRFVGRLVRGEVPSAPAEHLVPCDGHPFRLEIDPPGVLDRLLLRAMKRRPPRHGEVEIEVEAASLNFADVLKAMGIYADQQGRRPLLGHECAGRIVAVGEGVAGLAPGDSVVALAGPAFSTHVTAEAHRVTRRPECLSPEQAASVPAVFITAYYGLMTLARLRSGERVLIHSAGGGTGLAAVQLARRVGAEVFATAGSPEKRAYLRSIGIEHVMDSRSLEFAEQIPKLTRGKGVDVVLNSLAGEAIPKSFSVLAPYGRFVEIGKRDIYDDVPLSLGHFRKKLSYFALDMQDMYEDRPAEMSQLLHQIMDEFKQGRLTPSPVNIFPISQAQDVFRLLAQGGNLGKLVLAIKDPAAQIAVSAHSPFRSDSTYLITGGLGGLGLSLAEWMVRMGARHVALMGRRGAPSEEQHAVLRAMREAGAEVRIMRADVSLPAEVAAVLGRIKSEMPPLRGVFHTAAVVDDGILLRQDPERFAKVMAPKVAGAWNLHELTRREDLDFFVLYSSGAALFGAAGQGNYVAANAFLDALSHYRRSLGLPALSINWGMFTQTGLAAALPGQAARLKAGGFNALTPEQGNQELGSLLQRQQAQAGVIDMDLGQWLKSNPQAVSVSRYKELVYEAHKGSAPASGDLAILRTLASSPHERRRELLSDYVRKQLGQVLKMSSAEIEPTTPFRSLGVDSLMGLELRNRLEAGLGMKLATTIVWAYPAVHSLTEHLMERLGMESGPPPQIPMERLSLRSDEASLQDVIEEGEV